MVKPQSLSPEGANEFGDDDDFVDEGKCVALSLSPCISSWRHFEGGREGEWREGASSKRDRSQPQVQNWF